MPHTEPKTISLTDEIHQDEPAGYLVFCHSSCATCEYQVFADIQSARDAAHHAVTIAIDAGEEPGDWPVYPLYAGHPINE